MKQHLETLPEQSPVPTPASDPVVIRESWCKGCDICVQFCPKGVLARDDQGPARVAHPEACVFCQLCEIMCPDFAITMREGGKVARKVRGKTDAGERGVR